MRPRPPACRFVGALIAIGLAHGARADTLRIPAQRTATPPRIDGALDDPAWRDAPAISGFWKMRPVDDQAASESTQVRVLYDDQNLYLAFQADEPHPGAVRGALAPRDQCMDDDLIGVLL